MVTYYRRIDLVIPIFTRLSFYCVFILSLYTYVCLWLCPTYLRGMTELYVPSIALRSSTDELTLPVPTFRTHYGERDSDIIVQWGGLHCRLIYDLVNQWTLFKCKLKTHPFPIAYSSHHYAFAFPILMLGF